MVTTFENGPARGVVLQLGRSPLFLRVVQADKEFDALDQIDDKPEANEKIYAYFKVEDRGMVHICGQNKKGRFSGYYASAMYRECVEQPDDVIARDAEKWRDWCYDQATKIVEESENKQVMPKVGGEPFRCECGCNVFTVVGKFKYILGKYKYQCNSCKAEYIGEAKDGAESEPKTDAEKGQSHP